MSLLGTVMPSPIFQGFDNNGDPLVGGLLYTQVAGYTGDLATYLDAGLSSPNTNPVVLDSAGRAIVFLLPRTYAFTLKTSTGTQLWTVDGVASTGLTQATVGIGSAVTTFGGLELSPVTSSSYPSGATYDKCHANTSWLTIDSSLLVGTFALQGMLLSTGGTMTAAIVNLTDASDTAMQTIASVSTTGALGTSSAITFPTAGTNKTYGIKTKVSSGTGFAWGLSLVRIA